MSDMWGGLAQMWAAMRGGEESQIIEKWDDILASRNKVRIRQWWTSIMGLAVSIIGLTFIMLPMVLSAPGLMLLDAVWLALALVICLIISALLVRPLLKDRPKSVRNIATLGIAGMIMAGTIVLSMKIYGAPSWHLLFPAIGICIWLPSMSLVYNQQLDTIDPMGWTSPFEREVAPHVAMSFKIQNRLAIEQAIAEQISNARLIRWQHGSGVRQISSRGEPDAPARGVLPDAADIAFADFLREAVMNRGLSTGNWFKPGVSRFVTTTGVEVTRTVYDQFVERGRGLHYIAPFEHGKASKWLVDDPVEGAYNDFVRKMVEEWPELLQDQPEWNIPTVENMFPDLDDLDDMRAA